MTRALVIVAAVFSIRYFYWRAHATTTSSAKWFFYLFLVAEILNFLETCLFYFGTWKRTHHSARPIIPNRTVDVFIATYNEPVSLLRDTVVCALGMRYPHKTYLLDDGNRAEVRALAHELGCEYIARAERIHAKAGNLNNALKRTCGEFVVTLDADHVPLPDLIEQLIGFFADPSVGIVQTPQDFYNQDSFQHVASRQKKFVWQQQELFFSVIQPGKDGYDATFYCGSPAMCRRSALEEIGGFATETLTEDMHTGLRLQKKQTKVLYYNHTVAYGLAPQTYLGFATQWRRWGIGAFQVLRCENPLFSKGLRMSQRICYFSSFYFWITGYQKLLYILTPVICLLTGIFPLSARPRAFAAFFIPYFLLNLIATAALQGGLSSFLLSEQFNMVKLPSSLAAIKGLFHSHAKFSVTPKSRASSAGWSAVWLHLVLLAALVAGLVIGIWRLNRAATAFEAWALLVNICWSMFFVFLIAPVIWRAVVRAEYRSSYRFPTQLDVPVSVSFETAAGERKTFQTYALRLNRDGFAFKCAHSFPVRSKIAARLRFPSREISVVALIARSREIETAVKQVETGVRFESINSRDLDEIAKFLYWQVAPRDGQRMQLTLETQNEPTTDMLTTAWGEPEPNNLETPAFVLRGSR